MQGKWSYYLASVGITAAAAAASAIVESFAGGSVTGYTAIGTVALAAAGKAVLTSLQRPQTPPTA